VTTEDKNEAPVPRELKLDETATDKMESRQSPDARRYGQGPGRPPSKKQRILAWLVDRNWDGVTEARAGELAQSFPDCSDDTRRAALLECGIPLAPLIQGVVQDNYKHLEATLGGLLAEYLTARESGDAPRRQLVRSLVIRAKDHTDLAAHNPKTHDLKRAVKLEMALWLRTWLENPPLFPAWVELRKRQISASESPAGLTPEAESDSATDGQQDDES
jgi:hypothetical protein